MAVNLDKLKQVGIIPKKISTNFFIVPYQELKEIADKQLQIARENKNKYDVKNSSGKKDK